MLNFYFRFRFWPFHRHRHVILRRPIKFHPNRTTESVNTSYAFFKMAATATQINFRFRVWRLSSLSLVEVEIYVCAKFRSDWSIYGYITTCGFWKQTTAVLNLYLRFRFNHFIIIDMWFCICLPKFHPNRTIRVWDMTSSRFLRWRPSNMLDLL